MRSPNCSDTTHLVSERLGGGHLAPSPQQHKGLYTVDPRTTQAGSAGSTLTWMLLQTLECCKCTGSSAFQPRLLSRPCKERAREDLQMHAHRLSISSVRLPVNVSSPKPIVLKGHPRAQGLHSRIHEPSSLCTQRMLTPDTGHKATQAPRDNYCPGTAPRRTARAEDTCWTHRAVTATAL